MGHNPSTRDGKTSNRKGAVETRSADEIIKTLRGNLNSPLAILKTDVAVLLAQYDILYTQLAAAKFMLESQVVVGFTMTPEQAVEAKRVHEMLQDHGGEA